MLPPLPRLDDYQISPTTGFLPTELPLLCLPDPVYEKWEKIIANLQSLILSKRLRTVIDKLPVIPATHLYTEAEWRRAYTVLIFLAHGYIWGGEKPAERLPPPITYPLLQVCEHLEIPPVATYAGLCLWNYKPLFLRDGLTLENLSTLATYTGSLDEQWFYLVSVAIEAKGGSAIPVMLEAIQAARDDDKETVTECLRVVAEVIDEVASILTRMYENCDPHVFYHRIRPFLAGSKNMKDAGLPHGVFYDDGSRSSGWRQYGGGSNAQSSLIQLFDIFLGVEHRPTGSKATDASESEAEPGVPPKARHNFIHDMRQYMPGPHRRFLQAIESVANIRDFVEANYRDRNLTIAYDACLAMLRSLRDKHIQMVSRYIIVKSREARSQSRPRSGEAQSPDNSPAGPPARGRGIASINYKDNADGQRKKKMRGTGGTALIPFLKQARDETGEPAIDDWARRVLTGGRRSEADHEVNAESMRMRLGIDDLNDEPAVVGLAGSWSMETEGGGLCAY
ncbi:tryptophan 2,3- dioxygenase [Lithohypha guttulata]|uniref:Indoleamine 2,3-dioxygenase n=1 Tax=Lithohypha guttulata TaxID=1690604 RepID=A0AAN7YI31_9EURO|nr:tryptophan 2,3- dioxygenase [Lithohypha guttulata]